MARISTYPLDSSISLDDKLLGTDGESNNSTKNYSIGTIKAAIVGTGTADTLPIWLANGTLGDSEISVSNNTDLTIYYTNTTTKNVDVTGNIQLQAGISLLGAISDVNNNLGNSEQVLVSDSLGRVHWENYQGSGLEFQAAWDAHSDNPDLTAISLISANTGKYWVVSVPGSTNLSGITDWKAGDWAIISEDSAGNVFWDKIDNSSVLSGLGQAGRIPIWDGSTLLGSSPIRKTTDATSANVFNFQDDFGVGSKVSFGLPGSVYLGANAGQADPMVSTASAGLNNFNIGIGDEVLKVQTVGTNPVTGNPESGANIGIGYKALTSTTTGTNNIGIGINALSTNISGYNNVAISKNALGSTINSAQNISDNNTSIGIGFSAGNPNTQQPNPVPHVGDTFVGHQAGADQIYSLSEKNVYLGFRAGRNSGDGSGLMSSVDNVVIGNAAGLGVKNFPGQATAGDFTFRRNIFIGKNAGASTNGVGIEDNIILGSRGTDPLYLKKGNVLFNTGGFGNDIGIPSTANYDGGVSNNFVLGSNIKVFGDHNIVLNPNNSTDFNNGISIGETNFVPTTNPWQEDFSQTVIIGGGDTPDIKISADGATNTGTQNTKNTIINSNQVHLNSYGIYDAQNNTVINSNTILLKSNMGTTANGNHIRHNIFLNSSGVNTEGKFEGNTLINYLGPGGVNTNLNKQFPNNPGNSVGTSGNYILGKSKQQYFDVKLYAGSNSNIIGPMGSGVVVAGDSNLLFGTSNIKLYYDSQSNLAFGQNITVGKDPAVGGGYRAQRCLLFGFNHTQIAQNQNLVNSFVGGANCKFDSGNPPGDGQISNSIAVGQNLIGMSSTSAHFGKNNESTAVSYFTIGVGPGSANRANAFEVRDTTTASAPGEAFIFMDQVALQNFPTQADAIAAGLSTGAVYHTDGTLKIVY